MVVVKANHWFLCRIEIGVKISHRCSRLDIIGTHSDTKGCVWFQEEKDGKARRGDAAAGGRGESGGGEAAGAAADGAACIGRQESEHTDAFGRVLLR